MPRTVRNTLAASVLLLAAASGLGTADGVGPNDSYDPCLSANGRLVAFSSYTTAFADDDSNDLDDVYLHDRKTAVTSLQSADPLGAAGGTEAVISANGRFLAFSSSAEDLVPEDANNQTDVFVRDLKQGTLELVSVSSEAAQGDGPSMRPAISASGRFVAFASEAENLVAEDGNGHEDVFVHDRKTGETTLVSVPLEGQQSDNTSSEPAISANGRFVAFSSGSTQLVADDDNASFDVFVRDRKQGLTERASVDSLGVEQVGDSTSPSLSANGRFVSFESGAGFLAQGDLNGVRDAYRHDRKQGTTERVSSNITGSAGNGQSIGPVLSPNGRYVAFVTSATDLVPDDGLDDLNGANDIVRFDTKTGLYLRIEADGAEGDGDSFQPCFSGNARLLAFTSRADNFVPDDTNDAPDIFVQDLKTGETTRVSVASDGGQAGP